MKDLSFYIEYLLLDHDCVVLPQFGAFITLSNSAVRIEEEALFLPPKRMISFTTDIVEDDGLLVGAFQKEMKLSLQEAKKLLQERILSLRQQLLTDGQMDFGSLGVLSQDEDGHLMFAPCMAGVMTPYLFGLDGFVFPLLGSRMDASSKTYGHKAGITSDSQHITIRISRRLLQYTAAAAALFILALILINPARLGNTSAPQQATILPQEPAQPTVQNSIPAAQTQEAASAHTAPSVTIAAEPVSETSHPATEAAATETITTETAASEAVTTETSPTASSPTASGNKGYVIVLACAISAANANTLVERLHGQGLTSAEIMETGNMRRVVLGGYDKESDAYTHAAALRRLGGDLAYAWVMKLK